MFASEEYNYWVNSKNDVCGARLYNAVGGYANIFYLPSSFTPICVNNVNNGAVANICDPSTGPCTNCQYFNDNPNGVTFQYNGYTNLFTIKFHVIPCDTFHFWMGIADAQDFIYDSAILLPEDGFSGIGKGSNCDSLTAVTNINSDLLLNISPNPFTDKIKISIENPNFKHTAIIIQDVFGQTIYKEENSLVTFISKTIDLSFLSRGIYFIDIITDSQHIVKKIVKK
jgi:hypothetical protein